MRCFKPPRLSQPTRMESLCAVDRVTMPGCFFLSTVSADLDIEGRGLMFLCSSYLNSWMRVPTSCQAASSHGKPRRPMSYLNPGAEPAIYAHGRYACHRESVMEQPQSLTFGLCGT